MVARDSKGRYVKAGHKRIVIRKKKTVEHKKKKLIIKKKLVRPHAKNAHKNRLERERYRRKHGGVRRRNCSDYYK